MYVLDQILKHSKIKWDKIRNGIIREEIRPKLVISKIWKKQLQWYGYIIRNEIKQSNEKGTWDKNEKKKEKR